MWTRTSTQLLAHALGAVSLVAGCASISVAQTDAARAAYTIAFKSFAPNNSDIFIANRDGSQIRPLAPSPALEYNASFSADGRWIVFTSHRAGSGDIYRVHPDGSRLERLTDDSGFEDQAALSTDGKSLAFVSTRSGNADIWTMDLATRVQRNITNNSAGDFRPAWSPDGQWIAFSSDRNPPRTACPPTTLPGPAAFVTPQYTSIYIVHRDGSGLRRITDSSEVAGTPHWSPDGSRLVFYVVDPNEVCRGGLILGAGTSQIVSVDWKTGERQTLTSGPGLKVAPRWVDANTVAYQTSDGIRFTGARPPVPGQFQVPDWSPRNDMIVFHRETDSRGDRDREFQSWPSADPRFALLRVPDLSSFSPTGDRMVYLHTNLSGTIRNGWLVLANSDGSGRKVLYTGPLTEDVAGPSWSPSGEAIVFGVGGFFQRATLKPARLLRVGVDGTGLTPITPDSVNAGMPSWSPDGKQVVYRAVNGATRQLYIVDIATGKSRKLETGSTYDTFPTWSPRGDWIAFCSKRDGNYEIYRVRPDGTGLQRLTNSPGNDAHPSFSPDGEWIAFATARGGFKDETAALLLAGTFQPYGEIAVMRPDGSDVHVLTDNSTEEGAPAWVPHKK